jgi:hypothetical protein
VTFFWRHQLYSKFLCHKETSAEVVGHVIRCTFEARCSSSIGPVLNAMVWNSYRSRWETLTSKM